MGTVLECLVSSQRPMVVAMWNDPCRAARDGECEVRVPQKKKPHG